MTDPSALKSYWDNEYPNSPPLAHWVLEIYRNRWVRFHSLPESKRYAENDDETRIILERHNAVIGGLVQTDSPLVLLTSGWSVDKEPVREHDQRLLEADAESRPWLSVPIHEVEKEEDDSEPRYCHLFMSNWRWRPGVLDEVLRLVADDVISNVMILSTAQKVLYHPYDGGADVVLDSRDHRDRLKERYSEWLSPRPNGM
jgi:hypothetical protein